MTPQDDTPPDTDLAALERFVVDNDDLLQLESLIGRFNIFDALSIANAEIRHSNFLAFILDPAESHGQSQLFLRAVLMDLLKAAPADLRPFSPIEIDRTDLRGVTVRREWENIDLLITCEQPAFVIAFENKIGSNEHSNQLARYQRTVTRSFPDAPKMYVFLTTDGAEPSEDDWVSYSYRDLYRVLDRVRSTNLNAIGDDVLVFLNHYLNLIGTRFMDNQEIDDLCARIFKNHRQALKLIYERMGSPDSGALGEVESTLRADERWHVFYRTAGFIDFVPKSWLPAMPHLGVNLKDDKRSWFVLRFEVWEGRLLFFAQVNRIENLDLRREIIARMMTFFEQQGFKRKKGSKLRDQWTRVMSQQVLLDWGDEEAEPEQVRQAVTTMLDQLIAKLDGIPALLKELVGAAASS